VTTILIIFLRINFPNFIIGFWLREVIFKIHNLTFKDAQINFNDTQLQLSVGFCSLRSTHKQACIIYYKF